MRILVFSDIHGDLAALSRLVDIDADYYIAAGDLVNWARGLDAVGPILQRRRPRVYVLPGNHEHESHIEAFCEKYALHPLHGRTFEAGGWHIAGLGHSSPTPFNTPGEYSESEFTRRLQAFAGLKPLVLVCHCPPVGTALDRAGAGLHFGSSAIAEFIAAHSPAHFLCGHIHEAAGSEAQIGLTRSVNVGKRGYLLELEPAAPQS